MYALYRQHLWQCALFIIANYVAFCQQISIAKLLNNRGEVVSVVKERERDFKYF